MKGSAMVEESKASDFTSPGYERLLNLTNLTNYCILKKTTHEFDYLFLSNINNHKSNKLISSLESLIMFIKPALNTRVHMSHKSNYYL